MWTVVATGLHNVVGGGNSSDNLEFWVTRIGLPPISLTYKVIVAWFQFPYPPCQVLLSTSAKASPEPSLWCPAIVVTSLVSSLNPWGQAGLNLPTIREWDLCVIPVLVRRLVQYAGYTVLFCDVFIFHKSKSINQSIIKDLKCNECLLLYSFCCWEMERRENTWSQC